MKLGEIILAAPAPTPTTPPPGGGFQIHRPVPTGDWFISLQNLFNAVTDNVAYLIIGLVVVIFLVGLLMALFGFGSGNRGRGMAGLVAMGASVAALITLGIFPSILQGIQNSVSA